MRLFSFLAVLILSSTLISLLFQEAGAVSIAYTTAPTSFGGNGVFVIDVTIPNGESVPILSVGAVLEKQAAGRTDKAGVSLVSSVRCAIVATGNTGSCPTNSPLVQDGGSVPSAISAIAFTGFFQSSTGYSVASGYTTTCPCTATNPGYGYDTATSLFQRGLGYGYGYNLGTAGNAVNIGAGQGYGYSGGLIVRFEVTVAGGALTSGTYFLTFLVNTGSPVTGVVLSSPFTQFDVAAGGSGGGGGGGGGAGGAAGSVVASVSGNTATATLGNVVSGQQVSIDLSGLNVQLSSLGLSLNTLTLNFATTINNAQVTVSVSNSPSEGAIALTNDFGVVQYLSISVPGAAAGSISGGTFSFTLTTAALQGNNPSQVVLMHFENNKWVAMPTTVGASTSSGVTFTSTLDGFSPFAIAFDKAPPAISNLRPPDGSAATTSPVIAASLSDNRGISQTLTTMKVDGQVVPATVTGTDILYKPAVPLTIGKHTVLVSAVDLSGFTTNQTWGFDAKQAADSEPPTVTPASPAKDGFTNNPKPLVSATLADNLGVDTTKVTMSLDGAAATAPAITATSVSFTPAVGLTDGRHTVTVTAADTSGNSNFATWSFTVDTALPTLGAVAPADGSTTSTLRPTITAGYSDALSGIDTVKTVLTLDGKAVAGSAGATQVSFTPGTDLDAGKHTVKVDVFDKAGNTASKSWSFTAASSGGGSNLGLILGIVVVLILIVGGAWWYFTQRGKAPKKP